jgi:hypothetical protein
LVSDLNKGVQMGIQARGTANAKCNKVAGMEDTLIMPGLQSTVEWGRVSTF